MEKQINEDVQLLSANELAPMLVLSRRQIFRLNASGKLPASLKIGGSVRWLASEIKVWLAAGAPDRKTWEAMK